MYLKCVCVCVCVCMCVCVRGCGARVCVMKWALFLRLCQRYMAHALTSWGIINGLLYYNIIIMFIKKKVWNLKILKLFCFPSLFCNWNLIALIWFSSKRTVPNSKVGLLQDRKIYCLHIMCTITMYFSAQKFDMLGQWRGLRK